MKLNPKNHTQFRLCKPWGYYPPEVESKINEYEHTIKTLSEKYLEQKQVNLNLKQKIERLQGELKDMHFQMSSLELPEPVEAVEHFVLDDFRSYNSKEPTPTYSKSSDSDEDTSNEIHIHSDSNDDEDIEFTIVQ